MNSAMDLIYCVMGPRLYMDYNKNSEEMYSLAILEQIGDYLLNTVITLLRISFYLSPIIATILYRKDFTMLNVYFSCLGIVAAISFLLVIAICFRGLGRYQSESYKNLVEVLKSQKSSEEKRKELENFDFDFSWWPVDFDVRSINSKLVMPIVYEFELSLINLLMYIPSYIFVRSVGVHLLYPGTIRLLQSYLRPQLVEGRAELILKRNGHRYKVKTADRNEIDTIFIDNREKTKNGHTLLINSEGNMSFYPMGVTNTNLSRNYSVLGWNHPGFEGSTGCPFPSQEFHAIDAVIKFAIYKLNFDESNIMLYGWSIGGYSAISGATEYSNLKGLILDGTFDDIVHLAADEVPNIFKNFVTFTIRCHINLDNSALLEKYKGPVQIIRRIYDETISPEGRLQTNRTNNLAIKLLQNRYPNIFQNDQIQYVEQILSRPLRKCSLNTEEIAACWARLLNHVAIEGKNYPMTIGEKFSDRMRYQMAEFLLRKYMRDYQSSHCPPLSPEFFQIPWDGSTKESI